MRDNLLRYSLATRVVLAILVLVFLLLPFHAFITVWLGTISGHYTAVRLWKEVLLLFAGGIAICWLIRDRQVRQRIFLSRLSWLIAAYVLLDLVLGAVDYRRREVSAKALAYGLLSDLRFLAIFVIAWAAALKSKLLTNYWQQLILWPAVIVVGFGLLQMSILPASFLTHFGYGPKTINPYQTINNNSHYIRILSTLRGADPLGAYLILPISALIVNLRKFKFNLQSWLMLGMLIGAVVVMIGSYSRAAWVGAIIAILVIGLLSLKKAWLLDHRRVLIISTTGLLIIAVVTFSQLARSSRFQNIFLHTQAHSSTSVSSNQAHLIALRGGFEQIIHQPFGQGPGTSGPASNYNHYHATRIPENYFLAVGEESGWLGIALFLAINIYIGWLLYIRRSSPFALTMFASLAGITFVNMLSPGWNDDTLTYIWWGLAGLAMVIPPLSSVFATNEVDAS